MPRVELTSHLYQFFPALEGQTLEVDASDVRSVIDAMEARVPGFAFYVCDERGRLRQHVNVFIGNERVRDRATLTDAVERNDRVFILQALSGG